MEFYGIEATVLTEAKQKCVSKVKVFYTLYDVTQCQSIFIIEIFEAFLAHCSQSVLVNGYKIIPAKPLHNCDIVSVYFNLFLLDGNLRQANQELIYVNLHISQRG